VLHPPVLLPRDRQSPRLAGRQPPGCLGVVGAHRRGPHRRAHGAVRLRADPGPRHPGGARGDPDRAEPHVRPGRRAQAAVLRHFHRDRRPFGAEGPIIMTGGAFGSLFGQAFHLSPAERKTLLVAGAAGGMAAVFGTPLAAALLAVELLLFEWKPRSFIPVACAAAVAGAVRVPLLGTGPLFPVPLHAALATRELAIALALGITAGFGSGLLTWLVYACEDLFRKVPIHWMWWPLVGGAVIGIGGLLSPRAL